MKDVLGWPCSDDCTCTEDGNLHVGDPRIGQKPRPSGSWWSNLFKQ